MIDRLSSNNQNLALLAAFLAAIVFDTLATAEIATSTTSGPTGWDVGFGLTAVSDDPLIITANVFYISGGFALIGLLCVTLVCVIQDNTIKRITTAAALKVPSRSRHAPTTPLSCAPRRRTDAPPSLPAALLPQVFIQSFGSMINFPAPVLNIAVILLGVHFMSLLLYKTNYHWSVMIVGVGAVMIPVIILVVRFKLNRFLAGTAKAQREQREHARSQMDLLGDGETEISSVMGGGKRGSVMSNNKMGGMAGSF